MKYKFDFSSLVAYWPQFLHGAWLTLQMTILATILGFVIGVFCAIGKRSGYLWLQRLCGTYVEVVRNTPFLVQIFIVYFGLSSIGLKIPTMVAAVLAMVINMGAYATEIVRAGMDSIHPGQIEAAECLGLSRRQIYWNIILWPAVERVYPALTSQFVLLMLSSSVASQISAEELTAIANRVQSDTFRSLETYLAIAVLYVALAMLMKLIFWILGQTVFTRRRIVGAPR